MARREVHAISCSRPDSSHHPTPKEHQEREPRTGRMSKRESSPRASLGLPVLDSEQSFHTGKSARRYIKSVREEGSRQRAVSHREKSTQYIDSTLFPVKGSLILNPLTTSPHRTQLYNCKGKKKKKKFKLTRKTDTKGSTGSGGGGGDQVLLLA